MRHWLGFFWSADRLIRYDPLGCRFSDWDVADLTLAAQVADLEACCRRHTSIASPSSASRTPLRSSTPSVTRNASLAARILEATEDINIVNRLPAV